MPELLFHTRIKVKPCEQNGPEERAHDLRREDIQRACITEILYTKLKYAFVVSHCQRYIQL